MLPKPQVYWSNSLSLNDPSLTLLQIPAKMSDLVSKSKGIFSSVKSAVLNRSEMEEKVRAATNKQAWGASSTTLLELAEASFRWEDNEVIWRTIDMRLQNPERTWRHIYKTLILMEYLTIQGAEVCRNCVLERSYMVNSLTTYSFVDEQSVDRGLSVREKAKKLIDFVRDEKKWEEERKKAASSKGRFVGLSFDDAVYPSSSSSTSSYSAPSQYDPPAPKKQPSTSQISNQPSASETSKPSVRTSSVAATTSTASTTKKQVSGNPPSTPAVANLLDFSDPAPSAPKAQKQAPQATEDFFAAVQSKPAAQEASFFDPFASQPSQAPSTASLVDEFANLRVAPTNAPQAFDPFGPPGVSPYHQQRQQEDFFANAGSHSFSAAPVEKKSDGLSTLLSTHGNLVDLSRLDAKKSLPTTTTSSSPSVTMSLSGKPIVSAQAPMAQTNSYKPTVSTPSQSYQPAYKGSDPFSTIDPLKANPQQNPGQSFFDPFAPKPTNAFDPFA